MNVDSLISSSSAFSKSSLYIWKFSVHVLLKPSLKGFEHYLVSIWNECSCVVVWTLIGIALLWEWYENWYFPVLWPLLSFPYLLAYWVQHFNSHHLLGFEIAQLNSVTFTWLFCRDASYLTSKAHLTSNSKMSGSRWVITPSWLSKSLRSFRRVLLYIAATTS